VSPFTNSSSVSVRQSGQNLQHGDHFIELSVPAEKEGSETSVQMLARLAIYRFHMPVLEINNIRSEHISTSRTPSI
jgi:hypothetical protein